MSTMKKYTIFLIVCTFASNVQSQTTKFDMITKFIDMCEISQEMKLISQTSKNYTKFLTNGIQCKRIFCQDGKECNELKDNRTRDETVQFHMCLIGKEHRLYLLELLNQIHDYASYHYKNFADLISAVVPRRKQIVVLNYPQLWTVVDEKNAKNELDNDIFLMNVMKNFSENDNIVDKWKKMHFGHAEDLTLSLLHRKPGKPATNFTVISGFSDETFERSFEILNTIAMKLHVRMTYLSSIAKDITSIITWKNVKKLSQEKDVPKLKLDKGILESSNNLQLFDMNLDLKTAEFTTGTLGLACSCSKHGTLGIHLMIKNKSVNDHNEELYEETRSNLDQDHSKPTKELLQIITNSFEWEFCQMGTLLLAVLHFIFKKCLSLRSNQQEEEYEE